MKKIAFFFLITSTITLSSYAATESPMSYTILSSASATSTVIDIALLTSKKRYVCDTKTFICEGKATSTQAFATSTLEKITFAMAKNLYVPKVSNATTTEERTKMSLPLTEIPKEASYVATSKDGALHAFYTTTGTYGIRHARTYWVMSTSTNMTRYFTEPILNGWDLVSDASHLFSWNASSSILVYLSDRDGYPKLYKVDMHKNKATLEGEALISKKYTVVDFTVEGDDVYFIANRDNPFTYNLYKLPLKKDEGLITIARDVMYTNDLIVSGNILLFTKNEQGVGVLEGYDTTTGEVRQFTGLTYGTIRGSTSQALSKPFFGRYVKGSATSTQAIIWLHGGPYRQSADIRHSWGSYAMYDWMLEEAHRSGVAVLKLDYPGSYGYGSLYANSLVGNIGSKDMASLSQAVTFLKKQGYSDISLFGVSYGGYLALKGAVDLPKKITGALAVAPVTDWDTLIKHVSPTPFEVHFQNKKGADEKQYYKQAAILNNLRESTPPIILMHGDKDTSVPFNQSLYAMTQAGELALHEEKVIMYNLVGENHVLKDPTHIKNVCEALKALIRNKGMSCEL
jgi:acetyl esterase/lipase